MKLLYSLPEKRLSDFSGILDKVRAIIENVRKNGDKAILQYEELFDGVKLSSIKVDYKTLEDYSERLPNDIKYFIDLIYVNLQNFYEAMKPKGFELNKGKSKVGLIWKAIERIGIYVPGGRHPYPSSLLMAGIPARVAGVKEIYVATPPTKEGGVDPAIAYISLKLNVREVYLMGGAQAIAAFAYGTETVKKVYKIVGPGSVYVQAAKFLVRDVVEIDGIEGPTELVVIADDSANPRNVLNDLIAQGEHGKDTLLVLISTSERLIDEIGKMAKDYDSDNTIYIVKVNSIDEAIKLVNEIAPEHLSLNVKDADKYLDQIENVGAVSLYDSPPASIDYGIGPNHILPTNGWAKVRGGLTVYDFLKPIMYYGGEIDKELIKAFVALANYEGFVIHGKSIGERSV